MLSIAQVYGAQGEHFARFQALKNQFLKEFGAAPEGYFSSPGRCEIIGNHTDHNGGKILAASINMDTIGAAARNRSCEIHLLSEGYPPLTLSLAQLEDTPKCAGTRSLLAGICRGFLNLGFSLSGFDACLSTNVIRAAGVSSSASFEMMLCAIINHLFCGGRATMTQCAMIGKYAENVYWNKQCGLLDEMACASGGVIRLDFRNADAPDCAAVDFDFSARGYALVLVNAGKGHADLSREYSEIPAEMQRVAHALGVTRLVETDRAALLANLSRVRAAAGDRAVLRALHFFAENERVDRAYQAMRQNDMPSLLSLLRASGASSWQLLQNCCAADPAEQSVPLMLALSEEFLRQIGDGCCRVHGGGFAGTILCVLPQDQLAAYRAYMAQFVAPEQIYPLQIRPYGAVRLDPAL